jgi:membrane carboxypeptidase/penicillin-binding protein
VEETLQEGLWRYERNSGRLQFRRAEANLSKAIQRIEAKSLEQKQPPWQQALANARLPLYDVHWTPAVVVEKPGDGKKQAWRVGLADGRILPLAVDNAVAARKLVLNDVVFVRVTEAKGKAARAELRIRPTVQGTVVALENKTGRILAMSGGFSYPLSQLNRSTQAVRQPGSAIKPQSYLAALGNGLQPNTWVSDDDLTLPPIGPGPAREKDYWSPKNYGGGSGGTLTLRRALENSRNLATAHLLEGGIDKTPQASLDRLCKLAQEAQIYRECMRFYPFVLGAQPVRPVDLAAFYAAIANEGRRPTPYVIDSIERDGEVIYRHKPDDAVTIESVDAAAFYQLKSIMQGVLSRGTARSIAALAPYVAGKTGTTDDENDAWFVGFTNEVTVAVWVGYDNADGKRRTLGGGSTGGGLAVPIFASIIQAVWADVTPRTVLAPPSAAAERMLSCKSINLKSGEIASGRRTGVSECFRVNAKGRIIDTQNRLLASASSQTRRSRAVRSEESRYYYQYSREAWRGWAHDGWYNDRREWRQQRNWGGWGWR